MDLKETGYDNVDRIHLAQNRDQWQALMKLMLVIYKCTNTRKVSKHMCEMWIH